MKSLVVLFITCLTISLNAQNFQGKAFYKYNNSYAVVDWEKEKNMGANEMAALKSQLSQSSRKTYQLNFTLKESSWTKVDALAVAGGKGDKWAWDESQDRLLYKNLADQSYKLETEAFDKIFLVSGPLELRAWELTGETKTIGNYTAQQAVYTIEVETLAFGESEMQTKKKTVEAWFTPEIPISSGPEYYWGLPGLILEIKNGNVSYTCERVELNVAGDFSIEIPNKGQKVTEAELEKIVDDKTKEMYKRYKKTGKKG